MQKSCAVKGCFKPTHIKGWCRRHHRKWRLYGNPDAPDYKPGPERQFCTIGECDARVHGMGLCAKHYERNRKYGNPTHEPPTAEQRYYASYRKGRKNQCWPWTKGLTEDGYGKFKAEGKTFVASRFGWELRNGPIPNGYFVCHTCDTPACQNPDHWFLGTPLENMTDKVKKGRLVVNPYRGSGNRFTTKPQ